MPTQLFIDPTEIDTFRFELKLGIEGHWLLMLALAARGQGAIQVGPDVAIDGITQDRVDPDQLGAVLATIIESGILKAKRAATTLEEVAQVSPKHAASVRTVVARSLRGDPSSAPRDIGSLLSLLHELLLDFGGRLADAEARS